MSETTDARPAGAAQPAPPEELGLETGHLGRLQITSLAVASFIPAVGMSVAPFLFFLSGGVNAWPAALLAMIVTICVGLAITTFARRFVATGSLYSYIGEVFGPWARWLMGAALFLGFVTQLGGTGSIVGIYLGSFLTSLGVENAFSFGLQVLILGVALTLAGLIAFRGLDVSVRVAVTLAVVSLPLMFLITIASAGATGLDLGQQLNFSELSVSGTFQGMAAGIAFLVAFESCTSLAAETRDPKRNVPIAVMGVPVILGLLYLVTTFLQVPGLAASSDALAAGSSPAAALSANAGLPAWVGTAADLVLAGATFSAIVGFTNYASRFFVALGVDGLLPAKTTAVHRRYHSPYVAIGVVLVAGFLFMGGMVAYAGDYVSAYNTIAVAIVYSWVPAYLLICVGAVVLIVRERLGQPVTVAAAVLGFVGMAWLFINGILYPPAAPTDAMTWFVPIAIAVITVAFALADRRATRPDVPVDAGDATRR